MNPKTNSNAKPAYGETVEAGKITFIIGSLGSVSFIDSKGHKRTVDDPNLANALVETAREGSRPPVETVVTTGTEENRQVFTKIAHFRPPHELRA